MTDRTWRILAYVLIVGIGAVGFFRMEQISRHVAAQGRARSLENCQAAVRSNSVLRALIDRSVVTPLSAPQGASPELVQAYAEANKRSREFADFAHGLLRDPDCARIARGQSP